MDRDKLRWWKHQMQMAILIQGEGSELHEAFGLIEIPSYWRLQNWKKKTPSSPEVKMGERMS